MTEWYVKDLSKLTRVSVQTLHHYDRIGLLEPSVRLANGYRVYSERDLLKLQQIVALKYFGFELSQIKKLLAADIDIVEHFSAQLQFLEEKAKSLLDAGNALKAIISDCQRHESIPWETIIKLIEVFRMTRQLEKTWAGKVLSKDELNDYANFEREFPSRYNESEKKKFKQEWAELARDVEANLDKNPASSIGIALGKRCMDWVNQYYGEKFAGLRSAIWEKGFKGGHVSDEEGLSIKGVEWLDAAIDAYYRDRIYRILNQIDGHPSADLQQSWERLMSDMYGDDQVPRQNLLKAAMTDEKVSQAARNWLVKITKS